MRKNFKTIALALALATSLSGCAPGVEPDSKNVDAMKAIAAKPMPGFKVADAGGYVLDGCVLDSHCSTNSSTELWGTKTYDSRADFCKDFIAWAPTVGVQSWQYDPEYIALPIKDHEGAAQFACIGANNFSLIGSTNNVLWMMSGDPERIHVETVMSEEGGVEDERLLLKTWDEAMALIVTENMDALSAIETYRLSHPKTNPNAVKTVEIALKAVKLPDGSKIVKDKNGQAHYLYIPAEGRLLERCINIKPFNPDYFKMKNPGSGFVPLPILEEGPVIDEFAYTEYKLCPKS